MTILSASKAGADAARPRSRLTMVIAVLLSLLVNGAVLVLLDRAPTPPPEQEQAVAVELAPAPPAAKPEPPKPEPPKPEVKPEPPKVEPPKPEVKPEPPKPVAKPEPPKPVAKPEPPKPEVKPAPKVEPPKPLFNKPPQLTQAKPPPVNMKDGKLADESVEGPGDGSLGAKGKVKDPGAQTLRDALLSQILQVWRPPEEARGQNLVVTFRVDLRKDGMLGPPYAGDQPLNVAVAVADWNKMPANSPARPLLAGLVRAIHMVQPFRLTPEMAAKAPITVTLDFALDDIP